MVKTTKQKALPGLRAKNFPRSVSWRVDQDYLHKLTGKEKEFLADFNDRFYGADFRRDRDWSVEERRERYRAKNAANRDVFTSGMVDGVDSVAALDIQSESTDESFTPAYLDSEEYVGLLAAYRQAIEDRHGVIIAKKRLERFVKIHG